MRWVNGSSIVCDPLFHNAWSDPFFPVRSGWGSNYYDVVFPPNKKRARFARPLISMNTVVEMKIWNVKGREGQSTGLHSQDRIAIRQKGFAAHPPRQVSNSARATWITFSLILIFASSLLLFHFYFSIDIYLHALRTTTITLKDGRRRTNGKPPLLDILFFSCFPWLTVTFSMIHNSFGFRFATTMTTTITTTTIMMTTRQLLYIACKGCF
jgi:hypothetical protein